jgi:hypothetical protein
MRLSFRDSWRLRAIERGLRRSEPHLAGMMAIFARLNAGEVISSREQARRLENGVEAALAVLAGAVSALFATARWESGRTAGMRARARQRLSRLAWRLLDALAAADPTLPTRSAGQ